jgi:hypothetical protein
LINRQFFRVNELYNICLFLYFCIVSGIAVLVQVLMAAVVLVGLRYILRKVMKGGGTNIFVKWQGVLDKTLRIKFVSDFR